MKKNYGQVTFIGNPMTLLGETIKNGDVAPDFTVVNERMELVHLSDFRGKVKLLSVVPSIDTAVCDLQTRRINHEATTIHDVSFISVSCDLPFALQRYCSSAEIHSLTTLSDYENTDFGFKYGLLIEELRLLTRSILIIDKENIVRYVEIVNEIACHPDYSRVLTALHKVIA